MPRVNPNPAKVHVIEGERCPECKSLIEVGANGELWCPGCKEYALRRCSLCRQEKPLGEFKRQQKKGGRPHRNPYCRQCRAERGSLERIAARRDRGFENANWHRMRRPMLVALTQDLLSAAIATKQTAMFRGRDGLAVYRALGDAIQAFGNKIVSSLEQVDPKAPDCTCQSGWCKRHEDEWRRAAEA